MKTFFSLIRLLCVACPALAFTGCTTFGVMGLAREEKYQGTEVHKAWMEEDQRVVMTGSASYSRTRTPKKVMLVFDRNAGQLQETRQPDWMPDQIEVDGKPKPVRFMRQHGVAKPSPPQGGFDYSNRQPVRVLRGSESLHLVPGETLVARSPHGGSYYWFLDAPPGAPEVQAITVTERNLGFTPSPKNSMLALFVPFVVPVTLTIDLVLLLAMPITAPIADTLSQ